ncbi:uncharacterized protein LOC104581412 [Brachypodium distachyon]|uniref:uncharacterized protein LOC104581412 n=1 Tax=Brachypodium distachyon TaxID=15368 RepID=UPI00052FF1B7|nr:uncharacterized protein LOC104581412 [Brachypodium distachyon]|eukprot:XP_010227216.1 uncharacterized protein LOC104581412 [Brachypodium distachyon]
MVHERERATDSERAAANEISRSPAADKKGKTKVSGGAGPQPPRGGRDKVANGAPTTRKVNPQNITPAKLTIGAGSSAAGIDGPRRRLSRAERNSREEKRPRIVRREEEHQQAVAVKKAAEEKLLGVKEEIISENGEDQQLAAVEVQKKKKAKEMKQPASSSMDKVRKKKSAMRVESIQKKPARPVETPETEEVEPEEEAGVEGAEGYVAAGEQEKEDEEGGNKEGEEVVSTRKFEGILVLTNPDNTKDDKKVAKRTRASFKSPLSSRHQSDYCKNHGAINRPIDIDQLSYSEGGH